MESLRRPSVLAAIAAALLVVNFVVLRDDDTPGVAVDDPAAGEGVEDGSEDGGADGAGDGDQDTGEAAGDTADDGDDAAAGGDAGTSTDDGASGDGDGPATGDAALAAPTVGTYTYASSGGWSLAVTGKPTDEVQLPATATAVVTVDAGNWSLRLDAGDRYADEFGFVLGPDGGLDWVDWVLERESPDLGPSTQYACSGDSAHYRPDEQGRVATHVCETAGIVSRGTIEHIGTEEVTLGDGTTVTADRLLYSYTLEGENVSGGGQLDLWMDPATGLRVRESRTISSTSVVGAITYEYREDVEFTLQSLTPA